MTHTELALRASEQEALDLLGLTGMEAETSHIISDAPLYGEGHLPMLIKQSECFGTHSRRDDACKACPAAALCLIEKAALDRSRDARRLERERENAKYEAIGMTAAQFERAAEQVILHLSPLDREDRIACTPYQCEISQKPIKAGDQIVWVHGFGIISKQVADLIYP